MRKHFVVFESPGTFVHETSEKPIERWKPEIAVKMAEKITERHGARPFAFHFLTKLVADVPVPDGEGGFLDTVSKVVETSGRYFIKGRLRTLDEVISDNNPKENILLENMRCNNWPIIVDVINGYRSTHVFEEKDFLVENDGSIKARGDDEVYVKYRAETIAKHNKRGSAA